MQPSLQGRAGTIESAFHATFTTDIGAISWGESNWRGNLHAECDAIWLVRQMLETLTLRTSAFPELEVTLTVGDSRRGLGSVQ